MRRTLRNVIMILLLLVLAVGPAGCAVVGITPTPEPVTLKFAVAEGSMPIQRLAEEFHAQYPWVTVQYYETSAMDSSDIEQWVRSGGVDVFRTSRDAMAWIDEGLLNPMDDIQLDDFSEFRNDYYGGLWEALAKQGTQYGIPAGMDIYVAYLNASQAETMGVALPSANWELFDLIEFATAMNSWDPGGMSDAALIGFGSDPGGIDPLVFVYMHGGAIVDNIEDPRQALLADPLTIEATQTYTDLFTRYQLAPTAQLARRFFVRGGIYEAQIRGRCGVWFDWFSSRGGGTDMLTWAEGWKMYNLPHDQVDMAMGNVEGYYLVAGSEYPEEALLFIRFLADRWDAAGTLLPPRLSQQQNSSYRATLGDELTAVVDAFPEKVIFLPGGYTPELETVGAAFYTAVGQIISEDLDAANVLEQAQDQVRSAFE